MKTILTILTMTALLSSNEIQRVQGIVDEITQLRVDYKSCQEELKNNSKKNSLPQSVKFPTQEKSTNYEKEILAYKKKIKEAENKNRFLSLKIDNMSDKITNNEDLKNEIEELEKIIKNQEIALNSKEKTIVNLKSRKVKTKECAKKPIVIKEVCKENNEFPKLIMKEENRSEKIDKEVVSKETHTFKATAFRFKNDANVYDSLDGKKIYIWEAQTSFTSNEKNDEWVKITGYFINRKWLKAKEELWVKHKDVFQR